MSERKPETDGAILRSIERVIRHSGCSARQFYWGLALRALERCFEMLPLLLCYVWLDSVLFGGMDAASDTSSYQHTVWVFALALLAVFLCQLLCSWLGQRQSFMGSYRIMEGYRERLIDRVRQLPLGRLYQYRAGQLSDVLTDDVKRVESIFTHIAADVFAAAVAPLLVLMGLIWVDWVLAVSLVIGLPVALLVLNGTKRLFARVGNRKQEQFRDTAGVLVEFVTGIKTLRLFDRVDLWLSRLNRRFDQIRKASMGVEAWGAGPVVSYRLALELSLVVFLLVCANLADAGADTAGWLLFLLLAHKVLGPLLEVSEYLTVLRYAVQSELKIQELFAAELLPEPDMGVVPSRYDIRFDNVCFSYGEQTILRNVSFDVPQNSITAIVGPSGAGKSSLMNLLARFYDPQAGVITLGGIDLKKIGTDQLYESISMVFQQVQLHDATVIENIRIGRRDATDAQVIAACKAANCHDFIQRLPDAYQTRVGEDGTRLSGGERQRLSIARALLKDAPVLLLDEATASVDSDSQYEIRSALNRLVVGRAVIMIAHRLSTVRNADQIIVLDQGSIAERGDHQTLLHCNGLYHRLWRAQYADIQAVCG